MMRDRLRDEGYFKDYIENYHSAIGELEDLVEHLIHERGIGDEGIDNTYDSLSVYSYSKLIAMYSAGRPLHEIKDALPKLIDLIERSRPTNGIGNYDDYLEVVWLLSIGIMLEIDETLLSRVQKMAKTYEERDALVDFLLNSRRSGWKPDHSTFLFGLPYKKLRPVVNGDDPEQQTLKLKAYLKNDWYKGNKKAWWYETHHDDDIIYPGYWSFESGAIVKILGLDDSKLQDVPYYPYDMVHYKG